MSKESTVFQRLASGGPWTINNCLALCQRYGITTLPANREELSGVLTAIAAEKGDAALEEMMQYHPDRELILYAAPPLGYTPVTIGAGANGAAVSSSPSATTVVHHKDCGCHHNDAGSGSGAVMSTEAMRVNQTGVAMDFGHIVVYTLLTIGGLALLTILINAAVFGDIRGHHYAKELK